MLYRKLGSTGLGVSELGIGTWQLANASGSWTGSSKEESLLALETALDNGVNFIDTALIYGDGMSEQWIGEVIKKRDRSSVILASKIYAYGGWKEPNAQSHVQDFYPKQWIIDGVEKSLKNLQTDYIDLMQFHVWDDVFANQGDWQEAITELKQSGKVKHFGISLVNYDSNNCLATIETGMIDSVQMIFNIFHQEPIDTIFPRLRERNIGLIARVPLDEGGLSGKLTAGTTFEPGDFRRGYFRGERLLETVRRVQALQDLAMNEVESVPELALRFILSFPEVTTVIPGMRKVTNVVSNIASVEKGPLSPTLLATLRNHAWERNFYEGAWSI